MRSAVRGVAIAAIIAIASGMCAAPAAAQDATGLYEPFPDGGAARQSKRFVDQLPGVLGRYSEGELEQGQFVGASLSPAKRAGAPTARAEPAGPGGWVAAGIAAGLMALLLLLRRPGIRGLAA